MKNIKIVHENDVYDKELKPINRGVEMSAMNKNCPECGHHAWQHEAIGCEFLETTIKSTGPHGRFVHSEWCTCGLTWQEIEK